MKTIQIAGRLMVTAAAMLCTVFAPDAKACNASSAAGGYLGSRGLAAVWESSLDEAAPRAQTARSGTSEDGNSQIVGMWTVTLYVNNTTDLYDVAIEQFYADGNEMMNSSLFSPLEGNICFGVWQAASGPRKFKMRHIGWTFDAKGKFAGTARLSMTMTVSPKGDTFEGNYVADLIDFSGKVLAGTQASGLVRGQRFKVD
jgi:hypothetical protein